MTKNALVASRSVSFLLLALENTNHGEEGSREIALPSSGKKNSLHTIRKRKPLRTRLDGCHMDIERYKRMAQSKQFTGLCGIASTWLLTTSAPTQLVFIVFLRAATEPYIFCRRLQRNLRHLPLPPSRAQLKEDVAHPSIYASLWAALMPDGVARCVLHCCPTVLLLGLNLCAAAVAVVWLCRRREFPGGGATADLHKIRPRGFC